MGVQSSAPEFLEGISTHGGKRHPFFDSLEVSVNGHTLIDKAAKAGHEWSIYDALRQAADEYGARETERNETDRTYGMVALLNDLGKYIKDHPTALEVHFPDD